MSMEYCVMFKQKDKWNLFDGQTFEDLGIAKGHIMYLQVTYKNVKFRLACREVGEWCECKEFVEDRLFGKVKNVHSR